MSGKPEERRPTVGAEAPDRAPVAAPPGRAAQRLPQTLLPYLGVAVLVLFVANATALLLLRRGRSRPEATGQAEPSSTATASTNTAGEPPKEPDHGPRGSVEEEKASGNGKPGPGIRGPGPGGREEPDPPKPDGPPTPPVPPVAPERPPVLSEGPWLLRLLSREEAADFRREAVQPTRQTPTETRYRIRRCDGVVRVPPPLAGILSFRQAGDGLDVLHRFSRGTGKKAVLRCRFEPQGVLVCDAGAPPPPGYEASLDHLVIELADLASNTLYQCVPNGAAAKPSERDLVLPYSAAGILEEPTWSFSYPWPRAIRAQHKDLEGGHPTPIAHGGTPNGSTSTLRFTGAPTVRPGEDLTLLVRLAWEGAWDERGAKRLTASLHLPQLDRFLAKLRKQAERVQSLQERRRPIQEALKEKQEELTAARTRAAVLEDQYRELRDRYTTPTSSVRRRLEALQTLITDARSQAGECEANVARLERRLATLPPEPDGAALQGPDALLRAPAQRFEGLGPVTLLGPWGRTLCTLKPSVHFVERLPQVTKPTEDDETTVRFKLKGCSSVLPLPQTMRTCLRTEPDGDSVAVQHWSGRWLPLLRCTLDPQTGDVLWEVTAGAAEEYPSLVQNLVLEIIDPAAGAIHRCQRPREIARCEAAARYTETGYPVRPAGQADKSSFHYPWPDTLVLEHPELNDGKPFHLADLPKRQAGTVAFRRRASLSSTEQLYLELELRLSLQLRDDAGAGRGGREIILRADCPQLRQWQKEGGENARDVRRVEARVSKLQDELERVANELRYSPRSSARYAELRRSQASLSSRLAKEERKLRDLKGRDTVLAHVPYTVFRAFDDLAAITVRDAWGLPVAIVKPGLERVVTTSSTTEPDSTESPRAPRRR